MQIEREELLERYVSDRLSEAERELIEEHYFGCEQCFHRLEMLRTIRAELAVTRDKPEAEVEPGTTWRRWNWIVMATAGVILLMIGVWMRQSLTDTPTTAGNPPPAVTTPSAAAIPLEELARVEPPPYAPGVLRGEVAENERRFRVAMEHYRKKEYSAAVQGLQAVHKLDPKRPDASFFLAISSLMDGRTDDAIAGLKGTIALGDTAFLEEAHFYLAKAWLRKGKVKDAEDELQRTIALRGDLESKSRELFRQIQGLPESSH